MKADNTAQLEKERDYWKLVATHLADCHAATAESDGMLSKTSQSQRRRYAAICNTASIALAGGGIGRDLRRTTEDVKARCVEAVQALGFLANK